MIFDKLRYTWDVTMASVEVLKQDKELLIFPVLSGIACLVAAVLGLMLKPPKAAT